MDLIGVINGRGFSLNMGDWQVAHSLQVWKLLEFGGFLFLGEAHYARNMRFRGTFRGRRVVLAVV